ncbi:uncharacterized protein LOC144872841 isoform X1 [Branchiostoma floridae x Branchiostoma japonicum]
MGSSREHAALLFVLLPLLAGHTNAQSTVVSSPLPDPISPSQLPGTSPQDAEDTALLQATTEFYSSEAAGTQPGTQDVVTSVQPVAADNVLTSSEPVAADNGTVASGATGATTVLSATTEAGSTVARTGTTQQVVANDTIAPGVVEESKSTVTPRPTSAADASTAQMMATTEEVLGTGYEDLVPGTDEQPEPSGVTKMPETTTIPPVVVNTTMVSTAAPGNATENATRIPFIPRRIPVTTQRPVVSTRASTDEPAVTTTLRITTESTPRTTTEDLSRAVPGLPPQTTTVPPTTTTASPMITTTTTTEAATTATPISTTTTSTQTPLSTTVSTPRVVKETTLSPQLIPSKNQADLTNQEADSIVTVFFNGTRSKLTRNIWIRQYDEMFREELANIINENSDGQLNVQPADVIYVEPTPTLRQQGLLEVSVFVYNRTSKTDNKVEKRDADQPTVSKGVLEAALNQLKFQYEEENGEIEIVEVSPGLTAPRPAQPTRQTSIFGEYFSLFIALIVIACVCVVIILLGVLYLCVRKKKGKLRDHEKVIADDGLRLDSYQALDNPGATFTDDEMPEPNGKPKAEEAWTVKPSAPPPPNGRIAENTEEEDTHL